MRDTRSGLNLPFAMAFAALIAVGLIAGSVYLTTQLLVPAKPAQEPVSLLPREPQGITIMLRAPDAPEPPVAAPQNSSGQAGQLVRGHAVDLGGAGSFTDLSQRFARLARDNAEQPFEALEPRAIIVETDHGLEARLLVGPFETETLAAQFCTSIALPAEIGCQATDFAGERIARE